MTAYSPSYSYVYPQTSTTTTTGIWLMQTTHMTPPFVGQAISSGAGSPAIQTPNRSDTIRRVESRRKGTWDRRGNNKDRKARKIWMLKAYGDGVNCLCVHCGEQLDYETVQADRKEPGGSYRRTNVQPSCAPCNIARGDDKTWVHPTRRKAA